MFSHLCFDCVLLLLLLLHTRSLELTNIFKVGQNALLPCRYTPASSGNLVPVCWGRGVCPVFQCHDTVLSIGERSVIYRKSSRYHLKGDFHKGDVSLLIENVTPADSGTYCCRIQYPGPMNDGKLTLELVIIPAKVIPAPTAQTDRTTAFPRMLTTKEQGSETQTLLTFHDRNQIQGFTLASEFQGSTATTRIHVYVGVGVSAGVAVILVFGACILKWHSHSKKKLQNSSPITLDNVPPSGLANAVAEGMRAEDNIYTIEENVYEVEDSDEYYCYVHSGVQC